MITNGSSNVLLQAGSQGVLLVDTLSEPDGARLVDAVRSRAGAKPIRYIVNTHADPDFTGGNAMVAAAGSQLVAGNFAGQVGQRAVDGAVPQAFVVAHENVLTAMSAPDRRPARGAVRRVAHRHVLPGRADDVLQRRGHSAGARPARQHRRRRPGVLPQLGRDCGRRHLQHRRLPAHRRRARRPRQRRHRGAQPADRPGDLRAVHRGRHAHRARARPHQRRVRRRGVSRHGHHRARPGPGADREGADARAGEGRAPDARLGAALRLDLGRVDDRAVRRGGLSQPDAAREASSRAPRCL